MELVSEENATTYEEAKRERKIEEKYSRLLSDKLIELADEPIEFLDFVEEAEMYKQHYKKEAEKEINNEHE